MIVKFYAGIGPFVLIRLVADGEIEAPKPKLDRVREQFAQMQRAGSIVRHRGVVLVARQDVVVAIAEHNGEIRRHPVIADFDAADMEPVAGFRIGRQIKKEFAQSRPYKNIANAAAGEGAVLLID